MPCWAFRRPEQLRQVRGPVQCLQLPDGLRELLGPLRAAGRVLPGDLQRRLLQGGRDLPPVLLQLPGVQRLRRQLPVLPAHLGVRGRQLPRPLQQRTIRLEGHLPQLSAGVRQLSGVRPVLGVRRRVLALGGGVCGGLSRWVLPGESGLHVLSFRLRNLCIGY